MRQKERTEDETRASSKKDSKRANESETVENALCRGVKDKTCSCLSSLCRDNGSIKVQTQ